MAHAFALEIYALGSVDLKAPTLARMYKENAGQLDATTTKRVNETLKVMTSVQNHSCKAIKTKWGFTDVYAALSKHSGTIDEKDVAQRYATFETKRRRHLAKPDALLQRPHLDRGLYDYIAAFQTSGAEKKNVAKRVDVLSKKLFP